MDPLRVAVVLLLLSSLCTPSSTQLNSFYKPLSVYTMNRIKSDKWNTCRHNTYYKPVYCKPVYYV